MESAGLRLDTSSNAALAASLSAVVAAAPETARLVRALATRAMSEAQYFSTGEDYWDYSMQLPDDRVLCCKDMLCQSSSLDAIRFSPRTLSLQHPHGLPHRADAHTHSTSC